MLAVTNAVRPRLMLSSISAVGRCSRAAVRAFSMARCVGRRHGQHCIVDGALKRSDGVDMQRPEFHPLDRTDMSQEDRPGRWSRSMLFLPFSLILNVVR